MSSPSTRLQELMYLENISQQELADRLGNHNSLISKYLNPNYKPSDSFLRKVEDIMGWSAIYIKTGKGVTHTNSALRPYKTSVRIQSEPLIFESETDKELYDRLMKIVRKWGLTPDSIEENQIKVGKLEEENAALRRELLASKDEIISLLKKSNVK